VKVRGGPKGKAKRERGREKREEKIGPQNSKKGNGPGMLGPLADPVKAKHGYRNGFVFITHSNLSTEMG